MLQKKWTESKQAARQAMIDCGYWSNQQQMGRRWAIGCVALEITQRCNLDCTLCYLSEHSEAVADIPIEEVFRRIDEIYTLFGPNTDVQVTGGDPTLRQRDELISIISYIKQKNMRSTLMTNGIRATRSLLTDLAEAGLSDVVFHVDTTQNIKHATDEKSLNKTRLKYLNNTRGLDLSVMFNTTVHQGNFHEIPGLVKFFKSQSNSIRTVSFQSQADTGRGVADKRDEIITQDTVWKKIEEGLETELNHNAIIAGHKHCNRYGMSLITNDAAYDLFSESGFISELHAKTSHITLDRKHKWKTAKEIIYWNLSNPAYLLAVSRWALRFLKRTKNDLVKSKGNVSTLSFFVHNFMDACNIEQERVDACVFNTMTKDGPVSMCLHNAKRDEFILQAIPVKHEEKIKFWHPLEAKFYEKKPEILKENPEKYPLKKRKGKSRLCHCLDK
ncbi:MAG: radical SAM protein [Proteobacteria bacterium]|nr:radical SAM protein [Pseudomonadota bacterium]NOG59247.1 radical SAM protein [Pseudomonadota bacterium]